ncbi:hypothetical protein [Larsenimonas suaedae]|uniref:CidA/LrgA family protein n=1 Tax=Larsenimonas suaedae TaxID=1851019 RepID=A0ABU1GXV6_9GAMM|nr:hypothetical protein [Larsenimonas suaedae]MCM2972771.1 hypothetical protein [Larsenimonas suaedae]MDR5896870.1 hypothetical protein [Larsenimonas suaedae]
MLISDSLPLLWLTYVGLSLVILVTGYFAIGFLPRLPRWVTVGLVAGVLLMPMTFSVPGPEDKLGYSGWAPALVVFAVGVLQGDGGDVAGSAMMLIIGMVIGVVLAWLLAARCRREDDDHDDDRAARPAKKRATEREEPTLR